MANPEHISLLKQGVSFWNGWRLKQPDEKPDFQGADLQNMDLAGVDLKNAILEDANLSGADLAWPIFVDNAAGEWARYPSARIIGGARPEIPFDRSSTTDLRGADLSDANLNKATLRGADLSGANLSFASLNQTNLSGARIGRTLLGNVNLQRTLGLTEVQHNGPSVIGIDTIYKSSGEIPKAFLRGCGLQDWEIELGQLYVPDLSAADFTDLTYRLFQLRNKLPFQYYSVFISYSHADKAFARQLHDRLQSRGIRCWIDEKQLLPGDDIYEHVDRGVRSWDKFLLCCSEHSLTSWWVDDELGTALEKEQRLMEERGYKVHTIIPLNLDGYLFTDAWQSGYRAQIRRRLAADFTGWETEPGKFDRAVEDVIRALRADDAAREAAPPSRL